MSLNVSVVTVQGRKYIRVCKSYRNKEGKPRSMVIENHGRLEFALEKDPDYLTKLRERVARENTAAKAAKMETIESTAQDRIRKFEEAAAGSNRSCLQKYNLGFALLRHVWKDLQMPRLFRYLQTKTKIEYSYDKAAFLLVSQRILDPGSKQIAFERKDASIVPLNEVADLNVVYRVLDRLADDKANIVRHMNREIGRKLDRKVTAAFYDVTTYEFESRRDGALRNFGLSKANKLNEVQVVLGLVMDEHGIPIDYELFPGNTSEFGTMLPIIKRIKSTYKLTTLTVVADRGLNSNENLVALQGLGCDFVIAQKVRNCSAERKAEIQRDDNWTEYVVEGDEVLCMYKTLEMDCPIFETKISEETGRKYQTSKKINELKVNWIVSYSEAWARKDNDDLDRALEKARKAIESKRPLTSSRGYKGYIKVPKSSGTLELNQEKVEDARKWAGYYAVCTNRKDLSPKEVMTIYRNLWRIEDCFRVSKTTLETRPCFVWTDEHVRGHFASCFMSLMIEKYMEHVLKQKFGEITTNSMCEALRGAEVAFDDFNPEMPLYLRLYSEETRFDEMLEAFGLEPPNRYEQRVTLAKKLHLKEIAG